MNKGESRAFNSIPERSIKPKALLLEWIKHWVKFHIPEVLPSTLCGQLGISWNYQSSEGCLIASNRAREGTRMREAVRGHYCVGSIFWEYEFNLLPNSLGVETINKLCAPEEGTYLGHVHPVGGRSLRPQIWNLGKGRGGTYQRWGARDSQLLHSVWGATLLVLLTPSFQAPFCIQIPANSQTPQGWEHSLKAKVKTSLNQGMQRIEWIGMKHFQLPLRRPQ